MLFSEKVAELWINPLTSAQFGEKNKTELYRTKLMEAAQIGIATHK